MMRKYILTALLLLGLFGTSDLFAQYHGPHGPAAYRKHRKMIKKEQKINRKMFRDRGYKAAKKEAKSHKKEYKMHDKEKTGE